jgi:porin
VSVKLFVPPKRFFTKPVVSINVQRICEPLNCVVGLLERQRPGVVLAVIAVVLAGIATAKAQSSSNQVESAALPASPAPDNSDFDDKLTDGWWGERQRLEQKGISLNAQLVLEGFGNAQGGVDTGFVGASTFDLNLSLDTEKAFDWKGGKFYVDLEDHAGRDPSQDLTGDLQIFDKLNSPPYLQIFELWYEQKLFDDQLRIKLGKVDANTEFAVIDNGLTFLNASTQVSPTITPFPTTPDPMPGANVFFTPGKVWYASFGAFYANRSDTFGDFTGHPQSIQPTEYGTLFIGETGVRWQQAPLWDAGGNLKVGVWGHNGTFTRLDGSPQNGSGGYYGIFNQTLWQPAGETEQGRNLGAFVEGGQTQSSVSVINWNLAGGLAWTGPFAARPADILGFSANYAHLSQQAELPHSYELALESLYSVQLTKWLTLLPDFQFIIHPGGRYPRAAVGTLNLTMQF